MNDLTEKEALYILRHRKKYKDNEIDMAINKIKRINSHRAEYIKRYKEKLKRSIPKKKIEDKIEDWKNINKIKSSTNYSQKELIKILTNELQGLLEDK